MTIVYKPSAKALAKGAFESEDERIVLLGDGSALHYRGSALIQSDLLYRRPDSHLVVTTESLPSELFASKSEMAHIRDNNISLPVKVQLQP